VDFSIKNKFFYLVKSPFLYPEEQCNIKYNIVNDDYLFYFMEKHEKNLEMVKNSKGILPNMKINKDK
jgi:hypothetical protein